MKIIVLASTFPSSHDEKVPSFVRDQIIALKKLNPKHTYYVLIPRNLNQKTITPNPYYVEVRFGYFFKKFEILTSHGIMPAIQKNKLNILLVPFFITAQIFALFKLSIQIKPDFYYTHWFMPQGITASIVSMFTKVPVILTSHSTDVKIMSKLPFGKLIVKKMVPRFHRITAVSNRSMQRISSYFTKPEWNNIKSRTCVIPMGIDVASFKKLSEHNITKSKQALGLKHNHTYVLSLGRLAKIKGLNYLIEAFRLIDNMNDDASKNLYLLIAGDGPLLKKLQDKVELLNLEKRIKFIGYVSGNSKYQYITVSDIFVISSITMPNGDTEGFPVSLMEAMATGKLCIASDSSGAENIIINGVNGFIVREKRADILAQKIIEVLSLSAKEKETISRNARNAVENLDWKIVGKQHLEFFFGPQAEI